MPTNCRQCLPVLRPGQVYLWTLLTDDTTDAATAGRLQAILSPDEKYEARRFLRAADRHQFVIARALVRLALSHHFSIRADAWRFDRDRNRRPFIDFPTIFPPVRFSVSHTGGLVACLITLSADAAVDVEKVEHSEDLVRVAGQVLSPGEQEALSLLSGRDWTRRFFDHWTLKEAYAKARGLGLSLTLSNVGFEIKPDNTISAYFASQIDDDLSAWVFCHCHLSARHTISVAVRKDFDNECEIILRPVKFDGARIAHEVSARGDPDDVGTSWLHTARGIQVRAHPVADVLGTQ